MFVYFWGLIHVRGGGFNPSEKYQSKWESSPNGGDPWNHHLVLFFSEAGKQTAMTDSQLENQLMDVQWIFHMRSLKTRSKPKWSRNIHHMFRVLFHMKFITPNTPLKMNMEDKEDNNEGLEDEFLGSSRSFSGVYNSKQTLNATKKHNGSHLPSVFRRQLLVYRWSTLASI